MVPVILFSWLLFAVTDPAQLLTYVIRLFSFTASGVNPGDYLLALKDYGAVLAAGIAFSVPALHKLWQEKIRDSALGTLILLAVFAVCLYRMALGQNDPFMYAGF